MTATCETCRFFTMKMSKASAFSYSAGVGECRRHAPRGPVELERGTNFSQVFNVMIMTAFPPVPFDDWCGEHQVKAEAIAAPKPDADGWIEWHGGECPLAPEASTEVRLRGFAEGVAGVRMASNWDWTTRSHYPIIAYRVVREDK